MCNDGEYVYEKELQQGMKLNICSTGIKQRNKQSSLGVVRVGAGGHQISVFDLFSRQLKLLTFY